MTDVDVAKHPQQLLCVCLQTAFHVVIDPDGCICICCGCKRQYRLQSIGGLKITDRR